MARDRGAILHNPNGVKGRPTLDSVKEFLGRVNKPNLFYAAVLAKAKENRTREGQKHYQWLLSIKRHLSVMDVKTQDFVGQCIEFTGNTNEKGYGRFDANLCDSDGKPFGQVGVYGKGKLMVRRRRVNPQERKVKYVRVHWAHRFAFLLANGYLPDKHVGHDHSRSHTGACVNPFHLSPQTLWDNVKEMNDRLRAQRELGTRKHLKAVKRPPPRSPGRKPADTADMVGGVPV